jgi:hypothetical protein
MINIVARNAPAALAEGQWKFNCCDPRVEETRNGEALVLQEPVILQIWHPTERVITCPQRDANPFFHVMEWVWMLSGSSEVLWLTKFNKNMATFADRGILRGAYGYRWFRHAQFDQVGAVIGVLKENPDSRRAVLTMWDPYEDLSTVWKDIPCNTHIYFRRVNGKLDMTVCNRSNDFFWGMLGANVVHMTYMHELIALSTGIPIGVYRVFSNNVHIYLGIEGYPALQTSPLVKDVYHSALPYPLLQDDETWVHLQDDASAMMGGCKGNELRTKWFRNVAYPIMMAYLDKEARDLHIDFIKAEDWKIACSEWAKRRQYDHEA